MREREREEEKDFCGFFFFFFFGVKKFVFRRACGKVEGEVKEGGRVRFLYSDAFITVHVARWVDLVGSSLWLFLAFSMGVYTGLDLKFLGGRRSLKLVQKRPRKFWEIAIRSLCLSASAVFKLYAFI